MRINSSHPKLTPWQQETSTRQGSTPPPSEPAEGQPCCLHILSGRLRLTALVFLYNKTCNNNKSYRLITQKAPLFSLQVPNSGDAPILPLSITPFIMCLIWLLVWLSMKWGVWGGANPAFCVCLCADSYGKLHLGSEGMWAHAGCITEATGVYKSSEMTPPLSLWWCLLLPVHPPPTCHHYCTSFSFSPLPRLCNRFVWRPCIISSNADCRETGDKF